MKLIVENSTDPRHNLAREEALLKGVEQETLYLWRNSPSVIIGRNQNTLAEIDEAAAKEEDILIVRRLTGGGAVYQDLGNVNFSYIFAGGDPEKRRLQGIAMMEEWLAATGAECFFSGRNDLCVRDRQGRLCKVCGTAMTQRGDKGIFHGCVLFDSDLEMMSRVLTPAREKLRSKGVPSVRRRVANLKQQTAGLEDMSREDFFSGWEVFLRESHEEILRGGVYDRPDYISTLVACRYGNRNWNFGRNPACTLENCRRFPAGTVTVHMDVQEGRLVSCSFSGDYFDQHGFASFARALEGAPFNEADFEQVLERTGAEKCFKTDNKAEIIEFLMGRSV